MRTFRIGAWLVGGLALAGTSGCSFFKPAPVNPSVLNAAGVVKPPAARTLATDDINPREVLTARYLRVMSRLEANPAPTLEEVRAYAASGVAVVQTHCLRWFGDISARQIKREHEDANYNVIRQLGTALLGIGGANSLIVSAYGAGNVAWEALGDNFDSAYLAAPNGKKVKQQVFALLDARATELIGAGVDAAPTFDATYKALERYADLCTHATAKEIVNAALDQTQAGFDEKGNIEMVAKSASLQKAKEIEAASLEAKRAKESAESLSRRVNTADKAKEAAEERLRDTSRQLDQAQTQVQRSQAQLDDALKRAQELEEQRRSLARRLEEAQEALKAMPPR